MGINPLNFQEIKAYIEITDAVLTSEEVLLIIEMSRAYVSELNDKNPFKPAPFGTKIANGGGFASAFKALATIKK